MDKIEICNDSSFFKDLQDKFGLTEIKPAREVGKAIKYPAIYQVIKDLEGLNFNIPEFNQENSWEFFSLKSDEVKTIWELVKPDLDYAKVYAFQYLNTDLIEPNSFENSNKKLSSDTGKLNCSVQCQNGADIIGLDSFASNKYDENGNIPDDNPIYPI